MKKLISLLETVEPVDPKLYSNIRFEGTTSSDKISTSLLSDINTAARSAGIVVSITTAVSGHSELTKNGTRSRHPDGLGVDIAIIENVSNNSNSTQFKELGDKLSNSLQNMGYTTNGETDYTKTPKVVLWQVADHYDHVHVSNTTDSTSGGNNTNGNNTNGNNATPNQSDEISKNSESWAKQIVGAAVKNYLPGFSNENYSSKKNKLINEISKIKKLL